MVNNEKFNYFIFYKEIWCWHKKYSQFEDTPENWHNFIEEGKGLSRKYNQCDFAVSVVAAVLLEVERAFHENDAGEWVNTHGG